MKPLLRGLWRGKAGFPLSLQSRLFLTFVVLLLIVLGCFLVYVNMLVVGPLKERTINEKLVTAARISDQLDVYIQSQNQLSQRILSSRNIFTLLSERSGNGGTYEELKRGRQLEALMFQAIGPSMNIRDMVIYDTAGRPLASFIGHDRNPPSLEPLLAGSGQEEEWDGTGHVLTRLGGGDILSFVRAVIDQNGTVYGYLGIQLDRNYLQAPADGLGAGTAYVVDQNGYPIAGPADGFILPALPANHAGHGVLIDDDRNYVSYHQSAGTGWTAYVVTPERTVLGPVNSVSNISILLITALMVFSFVYIYLSAKNLLLPIRKLRGQLWRISYSNMRFKMDNRSHNNELTLLNEAFQELLERLQQSIDREKQAIHEEARARSSALQAQIAPHFIHNVLYLISIASQEGRNVLVSEMCKHLSEMLRYIVSSPYAHVTLAEELRHTRHYLALAGQQYEEDLEWVIEADEKEAELIRLPRLVIQPFVENCIEHAFKRADPPWRVTVRVKLFNGLWAVDISDNGDGFEEAEIRRILKRLEDTDIDAPGGGDEETSLGKMGIINSVNRMKLMYHHRLFFNLYNHREGGATVQLIASLSEDFY